MFVFFPAIDCGSPGNGSGADQIQVHAFHYPEKVDYHCQYGYHDNTTREVAVSLTCQSNGTWTRAPPVCIGKDMDGNPGILSLRSKVTTVGIICLFPRLHN